MLFVLLILLSQLAYEHHAGLRLEFPAGLEHWLCGLGDLPVEVLKLYVKVLSMGFFLTLDN